MKEEVGLLAWAALSLATLVGGVPDNGADRLYFAGIARDTWRSIASMVCPETGLPYDNSEKGEFTSVSNIGIYLTSIVAARELKLISADEALKRLRLAVGSVEKLQTTFGFAQSWNSVRTLRPATHDPWISLLDSGNLCAGLITVGQACPDLRARCRKLVDAMEWGRFWDEGQKALLGGHNPSKREFNMEWRLDALGTDALLAQFFAIAAGGAPPSLWMSLRRDKETRHGLSYLWPGWQGGGLFMQYVAGLWLDLRQTEIGQSARNFALAQIRHKDAIGAPVWGWSACDDPAGGYLGWGSMKDSVVTPHACALAVESFPTQTAQNLRRFEELGVRSPKEGFYDAYDWKTKKRSQLFLMWDQGLLFVSLANYLQKGCVRGFFNGDPTVKQGLRRIPGLAPK